MPIVSANLVRVGGWDGGACCASSCWLWPKPAGRVAEDMISELRKLAGARIYFGHHSVGDDMLRGLHSLAAENDVTDLELIDLKFGGRAALPAAFLAHSRVGRNQDPLSKIADFARKLRDEIPTRLDIALMKFCYVDFDPHTDVSHVFEEYRRTLDCLQTEFPHVLFVHSTVPLMARDLGLKSRIKLLLGQSPWRDEANVVRHDFNEIVRRSFEADRILDIARVESTKSDGGREEFRRAGRSYYSLNPAYTRDGGHLNEAGGRAVALEMLRVLARNL